MAEALGVAGSTVGIVSLRIQVCQGLRKCYGSWKDAPKDVVRMCKLGESLGESLNVLELAIKEKGERLRPRLGYRLVSIHVL